MRLQDISTQERDIAKRVQYLVKRLRDLAKRQRDLAARTEGLIWRTSWLSDQGGKHMPILWSTLKDSDIPLDIALVGLLVLDPPTSLNRNAEHLRQEFLRWLELYERKMIDQSAVMPRDPNPDPPTPPPRKKR